MPASYKDPRAYMYFLLGVDPPPKQPRPVVMPQAQMSPPPKPQPSKKKPAKG